MTVNSPSPAQPARTAASPRSSAPARRSRSASPTSSARRTRSAARPGSAPARAGLRRGTQRPGARSGQPVRRAARGGAPRQRAGLPNLAQHEGIIQEAARRHGIDPNLIRGVIAQESGGRTGAVSRAGARGLMQLMPATARSLGVTNPSDPRQNIFGGSAYLARQLRANNGNVERALWAYNAGPGNLARNRMPAETRRYIPAVLNFANQYRRAQS